MWFYLEGYGCEHIGLKITKSMGKNGQEINPAHFFLFHITIYCGLTKSSRLMTTAMIADNLKAQKV